MTEEDVRALITKRAAPYARKRGSTGEFGWAQHHGIIRSHLNEFMNGARGPSTSILDALGLEWRIVRKRKVRND